jgi:carbamoylphosphate synthase small subunit
MKVTPETVVLINCGCEGIQKLARAVRARKVYTMVIPYSASVERVNAEKPAGLIFVADGNGALLEEAKQKFAVCGIPQLVVTDPDNAVQTAVDHGIPQVTGSL